MPEVSIVIPCFNRGKILAETLASVENQTFHDWECILVDDESSDDSLEVAASFSKKDLRFRSWKRRRPPKGANTCRNEGMESASGECVLFLDSDDLLAPECLSRRVAVLRSDPKLDFVVGQCELFARRPGDRRVLWNCFDERDDFRRFIAIDLVWQTSGPLWRRRFLGAVGPWDETLPSWQDWDFHVRALLLRPRYVKVDCIDYYNRRAFGPDDGPHESGQSAKISAWSERDPIHLRSRERLFERAFDETRRAGLCDESLAVNFAGLFYWLADRWLYVPSRRDALRVWRQCYARRLVGWRRYAVGFCILSLYGFRGSFKIRKRIERSWPRALSHAGSETLFRTPAGSNLRASVTSASAP